MFKRRIIPLCIAVLTLLTLLPTYGVANNPNVHHDKASVSLLKEMVEFADIAIEGMLNAESIVERDLEMWPLSEGDHIEEVFIKQDALEPFVEIQDENLQDDDKRRIRRSVIPAEVPHHTYKFYNGNQFFGEQTVINGDVLLEPNIPTGNGEFLGWVTNNGTNFDGFGRAVTVSNTREINLTAKFSNTLYVVFKGIDGSNPSTKEVVYGVKAVEKGRKVDDSNITMVYPKGKVLDYWAKNGTKFNLSTSINENITLTAVFKNSFKVVFNTNGGARVSEVYYDSGRTINLGQYTTIRQGYNFEGWYKDVALTQKVTNDRVVSDVTYYAKWTPKKDTPFTLAVYYENADDDDFKFDHSIAFNGTVGTIPLPNEQDILNNITIPTGFTTNNMVVDRKGVIKADGSTIVVVKLYRKKYSLIVRVYQSGIPIIGGRWTQPVVYNDLKYGQSTAPYFDAIKKSPDYRNHKWYKNYTPGFSGLFPSADPYINPPTMPNQDLTIYGAVDSISFDEYFVKYIDSQTGAEIHPQTTVYNFAGLFGTNTPVVKDEDILTIPGYSHPNSVGQDEQYKSVQNIFGQYTYTATIKYTRTEHTITFNKNNGNRNVTLAKKYYYGEPLVNVTPPDVTNSNGTIFAGWYTSPAFLESEKFEFKSNSIMPDESLMLYAKWDEPTRIVSIHENSKQDSNVQTTIELRRGDIVDPNILRTHTPSNVGAEFFGWYTYNNGIFVPANLSAPVLVDFDIFPVWKSKTFSITYNLNGGTGTVIDKEGYLLGSNAIIKSLGEATPPADKVFLGWKSDLARDNKIYKPEGVIANLKQNIKFTAQWGDTQKNTTLIYDANGGDGNDKSITLKNNEKHSVQENTFTRDGYTFVNWNTKTDGSGTAFNAGEDVMPNNVRPLPNILYAQWVKDVIEVEDPNQATPSTHVRVSFVAGANGQLEGTKIYDVKKGTIFNKITVPTAQAHYLHKFDKWSPEIPTNGATQIVKNEKYTASFKKLEAIATPTGPAPAGYVIIEFKAGDNGELDGPSRFAVLLNADFKHVPKPTPVANTYYEFKEWSDFPTKVTRPQEFTALFEAINAVVPNPEGSSAPAGFVRIEFESGANGQLEGTKTYDVEIGTTFNKITVPTAQAHYLHKFDKWSPEIPTNGATQIVKNEKYTASFKKLEAIATPTGPAPAGYVIIEFKAGDNGELDGPSRFAVLLNADFKHVPKPTPVANTYYKFKEWSDFPTKVTRPQEFTALFEAINAVVPNPEGSSAPAGFVRIEFESGANGQLEGTKTYDVEIGTAFNKITVPTAQAHYLHKFDKWSPEIPTNGATQIVKNEKYTASFKKLEAIATPTGPAPAGYVIIEFKAGDNGELDGPSRFAVLLNADFKHVPKPTPVANTYYEFKEWSDFPTKVTRPQEFTALFEAINAVVPNPEGSSAPAGFVRIEFESGANGQLEGTKTYDVEIGTTFNKITVPTAQAHYLHKFDKWSPEIPTNGATQIVKNEKYTASFKKLDVIETPTGDAPDGYVIIEFKAGDNGELDGPSRFAVLLNADFKHVPKPTPVANTYYEFKEWSDFPTKVTRPQEFTALFEAINAVVPNPEGSSAPAGFVRIEFESGANGQLEGTKTYDVEIGTTFNKITVPTAQAHYLHKFDKWSPEIPTNGATQIVKNEKYTASFKKLDVIETPTGDAPDGYVIIEFKAGDNGELDGPSRFAVLLNADFKHVPKPTPVANTYYEFKEWSGFPSKVTKSQEFTALFEAENAVVANPTLPKAPAGFVRITFEAGENGSLSGVTIYDVRKGTDFRDVLEPTIVAADGYESTGWNPALPKADSKVEADKTYKVNFSKIGNVIPVTDPNSDLASTEHVRITFEAGENGSLSGVTIYDVRKGTDFRDVLEPTIVAADGYESTGWNPALPKADSKVEADKTYKVNFSKIGNVIPVTDPNSDLASTEHVRITFEAGENGSLSGVTIYDVRKGTDFRDVLEPTIVAADGYESTGWNPALPKADSKVEADKTYKVNFSKIGNVIPVTDPNSDLASTEHVRITFEAGENGSLSGVTIYDVRKGTDFKDVLEPTIVAADGYESTGWNPALPKADSKVEADKTYKVNFSKIGNVIPVTDPNSDLASTEHVRITFEAGENGSLSGVTIYDVRKGTDFRDVLEPTIVAADGYESTGWNPALPKADSKVEADKTYKVNFSKIGNVIPVTDPNSDLASTEHVRITFEAGENGSLSGVTIYDVRKGTDFRDVLEPTIVAADGYESTGWNPALPKADSKVEADKTYKVNFSKIGNVIPVTDPNSDLASTEHVRITFEAGENGSLSGVTIYDVRKGTDFRDVLEPTIVAADGYESTGWNPALPKADSKVEADKTYKVNFSKIGNVIPVTDPNSDLASTEHVRITFEAGENGSLSGVTIYDVRKGTDFRDVLEPTIVAADGYESTGWNPALPKADSKVEADKTYKVNFSKIGNVIPVTDPNSDLASTEHVRITFEAGENGSLSGVTIYDVRKGTDFRDVLEPTIVAADGYESTGWNPALPKADSKVEADKTYKVNFSKIGNVIPVTDPNSDLASTEHVRITFEAGENGSLSGVTIYDVRKGTDFRDVLEPTIVAADGYESTGWNPALPKADSKVEADKTYKVNFSKIGNVIPVTDPNSDLASTEHVRITFEAGENGSLSGVTIYDVRKGTDFRDVLEPTIVAADGYESTGWNPALPKADSKVEADKTYKVNFSKIGNVIPVTDPNSDLASTEHVRITFEAGENGSLSGVTIYDVRKGTDFRDVLEPTIVAADGYESTGWNPALPKADSKVEADKTYKVNFSKIGNVIPVTDPNSDLASTEHVRITFEAGENGSLSGVTIYDVRKGTDFRDVLEPTIVAADGYESTGWNPALPEADSKVEAEKTYKVNFSKIGNVIPVTDPNSDLASTEHVRITFEAGENGSLSGVTIYDVRKGTDFRDVLEPTIVAADGYESTGWNPALPEADSKVEADKTYKVNFSKIGNVIPVTDPNSDLASTEHVRITFEAGENGSLSGVTIYDVRKGTDFRDVLEPTIVAADGYESTGWNPALPKADSKVEADKTYKVNFSKIGNVIPVTDPNSDLASTEHVRITFEAGENGSLSGVTIYDVRKGTDFRDVLEPTIVAADGYESTGWNPALPKADSKVEADKTYKVNFSKIGNVIPVTDPNSDLASTEHVRITFEAGENGSLSGVTIYDVRKGTDFRDVLEPTIVAADGYESTGWNPALPKADSKVEADKTYKVNFSKIGNVIPVTDPNSDLASTEHVRITFEAGENGSLSGVTIYDVRKGTDFRDVLEPTIVAADGYESTGWNPALPKADSKVEADKTYKVNFSKIGNVIPVTDPNSDLASTEHVRITFEAGENGSLSGVTIYDVRKGTDFRDVLEPTIVAADGYESTGWNPALPKADSKVEADKTYKVNFSKIGNVIPVTDPNSDLASTEHVRITFEAGENGSLSGVTIYDVRKGTDFRDVLEPTIVAADGYESTGWNPALPKADSKVEADKTYKVNFSKIGNVIPVTDPNSDLASTEHVRITFEAGENGSLSGVTIYDVRKGTDFRDVLEPTIVAADGYESTGWNPALPKADSKVEADKTYKVNFSKIGNVIPVTDPNSDLASTEHVRITFEAGENGSLSGVTIYDVRKGTDFRDVLEPTIVAADGYESTGWNPALPKADSKVEADKTYKVNFSKIGNVIPVTDPNSDLASTEHVRITFEAGENGSLSGVTIYDVRKGTDFRDVLEPTIVAADGYESTGWNPALPKADSKVEADKTYKVNFSKIGNVIPVTDPNSDLASTEHVRITFEAGENGSLSGVTIYDVRKGTDFRDVLEPTIVAADGYESTGWNPALPKADSKVEADKTYKVNFSKIGNVIPVTDPNSDLASTEHVRITFEAGENGSLSGVTIYDVRKGTDFRDVLEPTIVAADGYESTGWNPALPKADSKVEADKTYKVNFSKIGNVIPVTDPNSDLASTEHVRITFEAGENGSLSGVTIYDVRKGTDFRDVLEPTIVAADGYESTGWNPALPKADSKVEADKTYKVNFSKIGNVIPVTDPNSDLASTEHVRITFEAGENGSLSGVTIYDVRKGTDFRDVLEPTIVAADGYESTGWNPALPKADSKVEADKTYKVNFSKIGNVIPVTDPNSDLASTEHVRITFEAGENGSLSGVTIYDVRKGTDFRDVLEPTIVAADGYESTGWNPALPKADSKVEADKTYKVNFSKIGNVIPVTDPNSDLASTEHVRITFEAGENGSLSGVTIYDVRKGTDFRDVLEPTIVAADGYESTGWNPALPKADSKVEADKTYKVNFSKIGNVIPVTDPNSDLASTEHVRITFEAGENGSLSGVTIYDVRKGTDFRDVLEPTIVAADGYESTGWNPALPKADSKVEADKTYKVNFSKIGNVIPVTDPNSDLASTEHVRITFEAGENGSLSGVTIYDVRKGTDFRDVLEPTIVAADGYESTGWNPALPKADSKVEAEKTYKVNFKQKAAVIPVNDPTSTETPDGYVRITFEPGDNGSLVPQEGGALVYDVLEGTDFGDIKVPTPEANDYYEFDKWSSDVTGPITEGGAYTPEFVVANPVVANPTLPAAPEGFVRITFEPGDNGSLVPQEGGALVYDVLEGTDFGDIKVPTPEANDYYEFDKWSSDVTGPITEGGAYTPEFVVANPVVANPTLPAAPEGFVRITFEPGDNGSLVPQEGGALVYDVLEGTDFGDIKVPTPEANDYYEFDKWSSDVTGPITEGGAYTPEFVVANPVVANPTLPEAPEGFVRITFEPGDNGSLIPQEGGALVYDVLEGTDFGDIKVPTPEANDYYEFDKWSSDVTGPITEGGAYTSEFVVANPVVANPTLPEAPEGFVRITFEPGDNGSLIPQEGGALVYDVLEGTDFGDIKVPTPEANDYYEFDKWSSDVTGPITEGGAYTPEFVVANPVVANPTLPEAPEGFVRITFEPGDNGSLVPQEGGALVYDVLEGTDFGDIKVPTPEANDYYEFDKWSSDVTGPITEGGAYTPEFVVANPVVANPTLPEAPEGFVRITFEPGDNGSLVPQEGGALVYDVLEGTDFGDIKVPTPEANDYYEFANWTPALTGAIAEAGTYTANFAVMIGDVEEIKGEPKVVCQNAEVDLTKYAKLTNPHSDVILVAYVKGTTTPLSSTKVVVATKTTYVVKARNNQTGEESVGIEIELDVMPEAIFTEISADNVEIAVGERATLTAIFNGEANATIEWFDENGVVVNDVVSGNNSSITVENTASATKGIRVYTVKLTDACNGNVTEQKIEIEFYLDSKITIIQKNRFLFVANNNSATNGNYNFVEYKWFKISPSTGDRVDAPGVINEDTYTPNKTKMTNLDLDAYYQLETITEDGRVLRTEPFKAQTTERFSYTLDVYPNPAAVNSIITIESNIAPSEYGTASIEIYTTLGVRLKTLTVSSDKTTFELPTQGVYYIRFNSKYFDQTKTIIVK